MKKVKSWSLLQTQRHNKYFYDRNMKCVQLCHPLLHYILKLINDGIDVKSKINSIVDNSDFVAIENYGRFSQQEIKYYFQKYLFLEENGYFIEIDQEKRLHKKIEAESIKKSLANTSEVVFDVTEKCNLNCAYCGFGNIYSNHEKRENKNLSVNSAKQLLNYLLELWNSPLNNSYDNNTYISFFGGEPLLNFPFIKEIVHYVNQFMTPRSHFSFSITTNGTLLQKYMDFLYENNFHLLVSLDGNEKNNAYRMFKNGKPSYENILENVDALRKKYPEYFSKKLNFISILHNKNSVSDIYHFFKDHFGKKPYIGALNTYGINESQKKEFWKTYSNINQSLYESEDYSVIERDLFDKLPNVQDAMIFLHKCNNFFFDDYKNLIYNVEGENRIPTGTCFPFSKKIFLTTSGKILPCEHIDHQFSMGSISENRVYLDYEKIAERYNNYYDKMRKQCTICYNTEICTQCIFNLEKIEKESPVCNGFMTESEYSSHFSSFIDFFEDNPELFSKILKGGPRE